MPRDRCYCWGTTKVIIAIEHCPSEIGEVAKEIDRITNFALKETDLNRFGKVNVGLAQFTPAQSDGEK